MQGGIVMKLKKTLCLLISILLVVGVLPLQTFAAEKNTDSSDAEFATDRVIVKLADNEYLDDMLEITDESFGISCSEIRLINPSKFVSLQNDEVYSTSNIADDQNDTFVFILEKTGKEAVEEALEILNNDPAVEYAEPDYFLECTATPNDLYYSYQYALEKIDANSAWDYTKGDNSVVVGIIDTGIDGTHPDLCDNLWVNPNPNEYGYTNDIHGYNFYEKYGGTPTDISLSKGHGTHVAGIVGAKGNNEIGVCGINWNVSLAWLGIGIEGSEYLDASAAVEAIHYANLHDIPIINASWGSEFYSERLKEEIEQYDGLFITAAGNDRSNIDDSPFYPASYDLPNIITVANSNSSDQLSRKSNYGKSSVDLAAPGSSVYSTCINSTYVYKSGTSMAAPYVAGVAALIKSKYPGISTSGIKKALLDSVDKIPDWSDKVKSGGRLNAYKALRAVENCKYTIIYDKNGGSGNNMSNTTVTYGINTRLRKNTYLPPKGKKFDGWNAYRASDKKWYYTNGTNSGWYLEGSQPSGYKKHLYSDEVNVAHTTSVSNDTVTMYAQWSYINYTVTFNSNGGTGSTMTPQQITYGTYQKLRKNTYTRAGYIFNGWNGYRKSDNKWYYDNGTDDCWCLEGNEPNGYQKHIYTDEVTVGKSTTAHNDTIIMYANWLCIGDVDLDGVLDINDVTLLQKYVANIVTFTDTQRLVADVNGDGKISIEDATALQYLI